MKGGEKYKAGTNRRTQSRFIQGLEQRLPVFAFACLLCSMTLLLYQMHLNSTAQETLEFLTATVPSVRWYEEETDVPTVLTATQTAAPSTVQSVSSLPNKKTYVLNTSSKKIHTSACRYAISMKDENKEMVENISLEELLAQGYSVCSVCNAE